MIDWLIKLVFFVVATGFLCWIFLKLTQKLQPKAYEDIINCKWSKD
jgi:hypothetical protein